MRIKIGGTVSVLAVLLMIGCSSGEKSSETTETAADTETQKQEPAQEPKEGAEEMTKSAADEPQYIHVQHVLIGYKGSVPGKPITRSKDQAKELADEVFKKAQGGDDFGELVREYTDDAFPGIYKMANFGVQPNESGMHKREGMVPAFGDVGFPLEVDGIGMAEYDPQKSRYGWHIVKRIK